MKKMLVLVCFSISIFSLVACKQETNNSGLFYSIEEAYAQKLVSKDDLESIAHYHNDYLAISSIPYPLDIGIEIEIKEARLHEIKSRTYSDGTLQHPDATIDDVSIIGYYGNYNNCHALMLTDSYTIYTQIIRTVKVGGVEFNYLDGNSVLIWVQPSS